MTLKHKSAASRGDGELFVGVAEGQIRVWGTSGHGFGL